jgi:hypothetical protein
MQVRYDVSCRPRTTCCRAVPWGYTDCDYWWKCSAAVSSNWRNPLATRTMDPHWWTSLVIDHWRTAWWCAQVTVFCAQWNPVRGFLPLSTPFPNKALSHLSRHNYRTLVPVHVADHTRNTFLTFFHLIFEMMAAAWCWRPCHCSGNLLLLTLEVAFNPLTFSLAPWSCKNHGHLYASCPFFTIWQPPFKFLNT